MMRVGIDEVNFSPSIAGDCVVCALALLDEDRPTREIRDSKALTQRGRLELFAWAQEHAVFSVQPASVSDIGWFGIYVARNLAAMTALEGLEARLAMLAMTITEIVCDTSMAQGLSRSRWEPRVRLVKAADQHDEAVALASVVAKIYFDALMHGWGTFWPGFGMEQDHGSPSKDHLRKLVEVGPSPVHRRKNYAARWWDEILGGEHG